ncbi:unnamed protein product, partial [Staurois parvus]
MTSSHSHCACAAIGGALCPSDTADHRSRKELKILARSCDQLYPITADHIPSSTTCQCPSVPYVSAHQCFVPAPISATSVPHISAYQCTSMPHISAHLSCLSVSPISANQCHLSVLPISATYQCQSVLPIIACQ